MTTLTTRAGKGSPLTNTELDNNFTNLNNDKLELTVSSITSSATPTPVAGETQYNITALAVNATFAVPSGTPSDGDRILIRVKDDGTARTLAWNAIYRATNIALPTTTTISKTMYIGFVYNNADSKWDIVASAEEA